MKTKNIILMLMLALVAVGCCATKAKVTYPDGKVIEFGNIRSFWKTEAYSGTYGTNGLTFSATGSSTDNEALKSVVAGATEGAVKGALGSVNPAAVIPH